MWCGDSVLLQCELLWARPTPNIWEGGLDLQTGVPGDPGSPRAGSRLWSDAGGSHYSEILLTCDLMASEYAALQGTRDTP